jgi:nucleoid-associated protein YgaU
VNVRTLGRFVTSIATLLVVAAGVPVALMAASTARFGSTNPLAGVRPPWRWERSTITDVVSSPLADATVIDAIVRVSLCAVWLAVAITIATTLGELVHAIRHHGLPLPEIRGIGAAQRLARYIAVGLVTVLPIVTPASSLADTLEARPSAAAAPASPNEQTTWVRTESPETVRANRPAHSDTRMNDRSVTSHRSGSPTSPSTAQPTTHLVGAGESVYSIAVAMAGAETWQVTEIADAIIDANLGAEMPSGQRFTNPAYIETGWTMLVPVGVSARATINSPVPPYGGLPVHAETDADTHVVEPGETLWEIAGERLGDPTAWPEIWEDNDGDRMVDGRIFDDADLIRPGWELELPDDEPAPSQHVADHTGSETAVVPVVELPDAADIDDQPNVTDAVGGSEATLESGVDDVVTPAPDEGAISAGDLGTAPPPTDAPTPSTTTVPTPSTTTWTADGRDAGSHGTDGSVPGPEAPSPIRLEHAALLAAGVLALVGVRRRQRLRAARPRHRVPEPHPDVSETERRLRRVGAGERALRVDVACRAAAWSLIGTGCQIGWVLAAPDGAIQLRLTGPATLPAPWLGADQSWRLGAAVPVELLSEHARRVGQPCVALIQLGVTEDGDDVIIDLEAAGQFAVTAPAELADEVITAVAASLASSVFAEVAHLIGVSLTSAAMLGHRNTHLTDSSDAALDLATALTGTTTSNERTSFELRSLRTGGEMWEPAVVMLRSADGNESDAEICAVEPGHGLAIVIADEQQRFDEVGARLVADPDGWRLDAFGTTVTMTPIGVSEHDLASIADLVADASRELEPVEHDHPDARLSSAPAADATPAAEVEPTAPFEPMPHEIVVGLLGAIDVRARNGIAGSFERSKTVELIAWLATHRDRATRSSARTALWEMDVRDATFANVVSEARRGLARLVSPPEGDEWVGRTLTEQLPLHHLVVTDADLVEERLAHARIQPPRQAVETLRPAVESVREMPFAGTGYLWPDAEGLTSSLVMLAITATAEFAAHALSLGDTEGVFWATGHGLRVLSGHEELIALRMQAHARSGDLAGVRQEWESYERVLVADAWSDGEPAPHLLALRRELLDHSSS